MRVSMNEELQRLRADPRMKLTFDDLRWAEDYALLEGQYHLDDKTWERVNRFSAAKKAARAELEGS